MKTSSERRPPRRAARTTPLAVRREPLTEASGLPTALDRREEETSVLNESIDALHGLAGGILERLASRLIGDLNHEIRNRLARAPLAIDAHGLRSVGAQRRRHAARAPRDGALLPVLLPGKNVRHREPAGGAYALIGNHAGQMAIDAAMIGTATVLEADPPRPLRGMGEYWLPTLPFFNVFMARCGGVVGTPKNCIDILEHGEAVIASPEGVRA